MFRKIKNEVKKCYECQTAKGPNLHTYVEMQSIQKENKGELIAVDFPVSYTHLDVYKRQRLYNINNF